MINFRFHIVSLTAVLLALGIGLVLGTTFLDDALEETLKSQLNDLEASLDRARTRNDDLSSQLGAYRDEGEMLDQQLGERLYDGKLQDDPVLVVSTRGVDGRWVDDVVRDLGQADARVVGTWWLTDRLALDDDSEVQDLSGALEQTTDDADRLRTSLSQGLSDVLFGATDAPADPLGAPPAAPAEPALAARLREAGFLEYDVADGAQQDVVQLPSSGLRVVVVDGPGATVAPDELLQPMLGKLSSDVAVPVVVVQPSAVPDADGGGDGKDAPAPLVVAIRGDDTLKERLSTVDDLDRVSGGVATILAAVDARPGAPVVGHYGSADGASRLLPPVPGEE
jgi:hypothetical protein